MRNIFWAVICMAGVIRLNAQDSTTTVFKVDTNAEAHNPLLYNYTSSTINNVFSEELRSGALYRAAVGFDYSANSREVPAGFVFKLLFKQPISSALIARADNRMSNSFMFEDNLKTGATFSAKLKKWDATLFGSYNHRQMRNIAAPKEAFETIFYGNARFEGDTADFSNIRFYNYIYNQYTLGVKKKIDYGKYQMQFGVALSFLQVINQQELATRKSSIYTAPDGEYVDINYDLTFNTAKEGAAKFGDLNGLGPAADLHLAFMNQNKWKLSFELSDLGFIKMRKTNAVNYSGTKSVHFQGFVIPDLLNFSSQTFDTLNLDSAVRSYLPTRSNNEYSLFMPFTASVTFSKPLLKDRLVLTAGLQYRYIKNYNVYGYLKANYFIKPDMVFSVSAGAGGYSLFNLGAEFSKSWKYFDVALGTGNLIGLVAPSHYSGTGLYLRLGTSF